jgi:hypothetical protein
MKKQPSLAFCVLMDVIGCSSYLLPGWGEIIDAAWAPISAIIFFIVFGKKAAFGAVFNLAEEILPGTDLIPTFTIAWFVRYFANKKQKVVELKPLQKKSSMFG